MGRKKSHNIRGAGIVETALIIAIISVGAMAGMKQLASNTKDAICSPVEGLDANSNYTSDDSNKYHWDEEHQNCMPVQNGNFYFN